MISTTKRYLIAVPLGLFCGAILVLLVLLPELATTGRVDMTGPVLVFPYALWAHWILYENLHLRSLGPLLACALVQFPIYAALYARAQNKNRVSHVLPRILFLHFLIAAGVGFLYSTLAGPSR